MAKPKMSSGAPHLAGTTARVSWDLFCLLLLSILPRSVLAGRLLLAEKQVAMFRERGARPRRAADSERVLFTLLSDLVPDWRRRLVVVNPDTVCRWHRELGSWLWKRKSHRQGRPPLPHEIRRTIARIAHENPTWSARRIRDEARLKLGVRVSKTTVAKHLGLHNGTDPSRNNGQRWSTFIKNHSSTTLACDFFTVWTWKFEVLYAFVVIEIGSRRIVHSNVTHCPTSAWVVQQLREAIPQDHSWRFLIHDRGSAFNKDVTSNAKAMGLRALKTPPKAPQANAFCERLIGTLRRQCLDHFIILDDMHLRKVLREYSEHYNHARPHLSLGPGIPDPPEGLPAEAGPERHRIPDGYKIVSRPVLNGLHHEYRLKKRAA